MSKKTHTTDELKALQWFYDRRFGIQAKYDLWGPKDMAEGLRKQFERVGRILRRYGL